jgi:hypothetical protein
LATSNLRKGFRSLLADVIALVDTTPVQIKVLKIPLASTEHQTP